MSKLANTLAMAIKTVMARTFGYYVHTTGGPNEPTIAVYVWCGRTYWCPTSAVS